MITMMYDSYEFLTRELAWCKRQSARSYRTARREAESAERSYRQAAEDAKWAAWLARRPDLQDELGTPADYDRWQASKLRYADRCVEWSFSNTARARDYARQAREYQAKLDALDARIDAYRAEQAAKPQEVELEGPDGTIVLDLSPASPGPAWQWPAGKTFGELSPEDKRTAASRAADALQRELTASAPAIGRIMDEAEHDPQCDYASCQVCFPEPVYDEFLRQWPESLGWSQEQIDGVPTAEARCADVERMAKARFGMELDNIVSMHIALEQQAQAWRGGSVTA